MANDPWNKKFSSSDPLIRNFKDDFKRENRGTPVMSIFLTSEIQTLINLVGTGSEAYIVIYTIPDNAVAVAVGRGSGGAFERKGRGATEPQYFVADHNCPPDCNRNPEEIVTKTDLRNSGSIN